MTEETDNQAPPESKKKTSSKAEKAEATGKQKFTEKELKRLGLDPACYGFVKN